MLPLFTATIFVSAALLFLVQPMFARMVLPMLGGSPAVWNTALVFYQITLLAGYAYAHLLTGRLRPRHQALLHTLVVLLAFAVLPIAVPRGWAPPTEHSPVAWMLALLAAGVGLPFFVVSTTGPLIQKWFAATPHRSAHNPYFLYAASNAGSMLGLLGYPFLIEPALRLRQQSLLWTMGYAGLAALVAGCAWVTARANPATEARATTAPEPLPWGRRLRWLLLAFIPSSLMMGATTHITTDVAAIPLLWVLPLALYLASFILVFASRPPIPHRLVARAFPLVLLPLLIAIEVHASQPLVLIVGLHLLLLFIVALICHGELARDRPSPARLTEFYLWLAIGGALGGVFNALIAPLAFRSVLEYPIVLVLAALVVPPRRPLEHSTRARVLDVVVPVLFGGIVIGAYALTRRLDVPFGAAAIATLLAVLALPMLAVSARPRRFALVLTAILVADPAGMSTRGRLLHQERTFFGVLRVVADPSGQYHDLIHGTTTHGSQGVRPRACDDPLTYYHRLGPAGDVFRALDRDSMQVALAGLGAGALAAYAWPGQRWTFYEIDPAVIRIASDTSWFCYVAASAGQVRLVPGDARRSLAATQDRYDLLVLDAYSSDAIPVHLITREALRLYQQRLTPDGVISLHLSNRYFDLVPVVAGLAADAGLVCRVRTLGGVNEAMWVRDRLSPSTWAVLARAEADLGPIAPDAHWTAPRPRPGLHVWTDDYSSVLSVLR